MEIRILDELDDLWISLWNNDPVSFLNAPSLAKISLCSFSVCFQSFLGCTNQETSFLFCFSLSFLSFLQLSVFSCFLFFFFLSVSYFFTHTLIWVDFFQFPTLVRQVLRPTLSPMHPPMNLQLIKMINN